MEAQANTTREQSNKNNIYNVGWQPSHQENEGVGKKEKKIDPVSTYIISMVFLHLTKTGDPSSQIHCPPIFDIPK